MTFRMRLTQINRTDRGLRRNDRGFTLVEMIAAVALFAIVMLICVGTLLSLVGANRKAQALQSVMNNLNVSLDDMVRTIRMGSNYRCNSQSPALDGPASSADCNGGTALYLTPYGAVPGDTTQDVGYIFGNGTDGCTQGALCKQAGTGSPVPITSSDITIDSLAFYVVGTQTGDTIQPKVVIIVKGVAGSTLVRTTATFNIQATAVQRLLDL